jgi:hypothetical protein
MQQEVLCITNRLLFYTTRAAKKDAPNNLSIVLCIRCCGNVFTEPLLSNDTDTETDGRDL